MENRYNNKYNHDILLLHDLWMTSLSWEKWVKRYNDNGFTVLTPTWPMLERKSVKEIRNNPDILRGVGIKEIVNHFQNILDRFKTQPMIIGHSFGGMFTQLLLDRGYGRSGVAIHSAPLKGVLKLPITTLKATWPGIKNPLNLNGLVDFTFEQFHYAFTNDMPLAEAREAYEKYYIPAPTRPLLQAAFANLTASGVSKINYKNTERAPLLLIAGSNDNITPASMNKENFSRYHTITQTNFHEFEGRNHYTIGQSEWESLADYCLEWSLKSEMPKRYSLSIGPLPKKFTIN